MAGTLLQAGNILFGLASLACAAAWVWIIRHRTLRNQPLLEPRRQREPFWSLAEFFVCFGLLLVCSTAALLTVQRFQPAAAPTVSAASDAAAGDTASAGEDATAPAGETATGDTAIAGDTDAGDATAPAGDTDAGEDRAAGDAPAEDASTGDAPAGDSEALSTTSEGLAAVQLAGSLASLLVLASVLVWMGLTRREFFERYGLWPSVSDLRLGLIASFFILPPILLLAAVLDELVAYEHPILDAVAAQPTLGVFFAMAFSAAIVAPVFEEFMFRALLQGGAQKIARRLVIAQQAIAAKQERPEVPEMISPSEVATWTWWPLLISSAPFALMHLGHGAAPIALFLFAFAVGYLYRQTGRLWPCIVVHFVLNALTMILFGLEVAARAA